MRRAFSFLQRRLSDVVVPGRSKGHVLPDAAEIFFKKARFLPESRGLIAADGDFAAVFFFQALDVGNLVVFVEFDGQNVAADFFRLKKATRLMSEDM